MSEPDTLGARPLFRALVPWALALGAAGWLAFFGGLADLRHRSNMRARAATYVRAERPPTAPLKLEVQQSGCVSIDAADVDGGDVLLYAANECSKGSTLTYLEWHADSVTASGVIVTSDYTNLCPIPRHAGDKSECKLDISTDERVTVLRLWLEGGDGRPPGPV